MIQAILMLLHKYILKRIRRFYSENSHEMMTRVIFVVLCSLCLLLIESANSLKCRTGIQQVQNDQYRKIMQICKKSQIDNDYSNDSSNEDNNSDDFLSMNLFGTRFFINGGSKFSNIQSWKDPNENWNRGNDQRNSNNRHHSISYTNGNWKNIQYSPHSSNNRDFSYSNGADKSSYNQMYDNFNKNYGKQQEQDVDQRGFPEQFSIIQFMTHNVHNPELQDFIEEAVIECFHYLESDIKQNKCYFSENLLTCLIDKGKERCEDWDD